MDAPWFLSFFELAADADERAIKQAYARRLKRLDPASDVEGFGRLRQAYEAALRWCAARSTGTSPRPPALPTAPPPMSPGETAGAVARGSTAPGPSQALQEARDAMGELDAALAAGAPAAAALGERLRRLHEGRLEAAALFEMMLIDGLAQGALPARVALFEAARENLGWMDVTRLAQLGPRGQWIQQVMVEEPAWRHQVKIADGARWFEWIVQGRHDELPAVLASQWPRVKLLLQQCPSQLRLRLAPAALSAWQTAFNALPALDRDLAETYAGMSPAAFRQARPRANTGPGRASVFSLVVAAILVLRGLLAIVGHPDLPATVSYTADRAPAMASQASADPAASGLAQATCRRLDAALHAPGARPPQDEPQRRRLADVVRGCIVSGYWQPLPDPRLDAMGLTGAPADQEAPAPAARDRQQ